MRRGSHSSVDSSGNAVLAAATPELHALLVARGGTPKPCYTSWIDDDEELRRVARGPQETVRVSAAFAMVVGDGRRDRLERLLSAWLLAHGMSPDLMNWQRQTLFTVSVASLRSSAWSCLSVANWNQIADVRSNPQVSSHRDGRTRPDARWKIACGRSAHGYQSRGSRDLLPAIRRRRERGWIPPCRSELPDAEPAPLNLTVSLLQNPRARPPVCRSVNGGYP